MTTHTTDAFKHARFATHPDGRIAARLHIDSDNPWIRTDPGTWEDWCTDEDMAAGGWSIVDETPLEATITHERDKPTTCEVRWNGEVVFSGIDRSTLRTGPVGETSDGSDAHGPTIPFRTLRKGRQTIGTPEQIADALEASTKQGLLDSFVESQDALVRALNERDAARRERDKAREDAMRLATAAAYREAADTAPPRPVTDAVVDAALAAFTRARNRRAILNELEHPDLRGPMPPSPEPRSAMRAALVAAREADRYGSNDRPCGRGPCALGDGHTGRCRK